MPTFIVKKRQNSILINQKDKKCGFRSSIFTKYWQNIWLLPKFCISLSPTNDIYNEELQ